MTIRPASSTVKFTDITLAQSESYSAAEARRKVRFTPVERAKLIIAYDYARQTIVGEATDIKVFTRARHILHKARQDDLLSRLEQQSANTNLRMVGERKGGDKNVAVVLDALKDSGYGGIGTFRVMIRSRYPKLIDWAKRQIVGDQKFSESLFGDITIAILFDQAMKGYHPVTRISEHYQEFVAKLDAEMLASPENTPGEQHGFPGKNEHKTVDSDAVSDVGLPTKDKQLSPEAPAPVAVSDANVGDTANSGENPDSVERPTISWPLFLAAIVAGVALITYLIVLAK